MNLASGFKVLFRATLNDTFGASLFACDWLGKKHDRRIGDTFGRVSLGVTHGIPLRLSLKYLCGVMCSGFSRAPEPIAEEEKPSMRFRPFYGIRGASRLLRFVW